MNRAIYLDYSATTPVDPRVVEAMAPYWSDLFGNTLSVHAWGQKAAAALEKARAQVAQVLHCLPSEIVFTASGSESDNLALRGAAWAAREAGRGNHIVTMAIEHSAVGHTAEQLRDLFGFEVTFLPVDGNGQVDPQDVAAAIRPETVLVSIMTANNEVGTVQPLAAIGRVCRKHGVLFHTDAVQTPGHLPLEPGEVGVDLLALSAHKFYGPKGVGLLYVRRGVDLLPAVTGASHERGHRPGTVNVAGVVGLATALQLVEEERVEESARLHRLRDRLIEGVLASIPHSRLTGHPRQRMCHHASFAFRDVEGPSLVVALDLEGIAASSGAACSSGDPAPSRVLEALGMGPEWGIGALRLTLGHATTEADIDTVLELLPPIVARLRAER